MTSKGEGDSTRKMTAVATMGEAGQLFTVYEKNWRCMECAQDNYATRKRCFRCKGKKPAAEAQDNYVMNPALAAVAAGQEIDWCEAIDPKSYQMYYFNKVTGATQWERCVSVRIVSYERVNVCVDLRSSVRLPSRRAGSAEEALALRQLGYTAIRTHASSRVRRGSRRSS